MSRGGKKKGERTLTQELASFLSKVLVPDLAERAKSREVRQALDKRYLHEKAANRTSETLGEWVERTVEQVGAAWVLSCLFIRTLEDRELLGQRRLAGPGAKDSYAQFIEIAPALTARDYLLLVFREVASLPAAEDVLGPRHNPAWRLSPSHEAARKLLDLFQDEDSSGQLKWSFSGTDTRFLGDIYQDLSEDVRKRYALLQTPHFVEKFILDLTLEPAILEFSLEEVRLIDPTCGSGHFLLGAFERFFEKWRLKAPGMDAKDHARAALAQVYGVDLNPYAVAIARFRLTLAFLEKAEIRKLAHAPRLPLNLVVADSLLYGGMHQANLSDLDVDRARWGDEIFDLEDPVEARRVFGQRYHAVVGNPPYIQCEDDALREAYRKRYVSCYRSYALAAPFTERFFELAVEQGFVGLINANSFTKREFGKKLIEGVLSKLDLARVIDTSGAYIPGHGTPTVLLFGRNRARLSDSVAAVLGKRSEPAAPENPENGLVWSSIEAHYDDVKGFENDFISVTSLARTVLSKHPWSLSGGGAAELKERLEAAATTALGSSVEAIGRTTVCGEDDVWIAPRGACKRRAGHEQVVPLVIGEIIRDWAIEPSLEVLYPYVTLGGAPITEEHPVVQHYLWKYRALLENRTVFGKTLREKGNGWYEHLEHYTDKLRTPLSIAFAFVATHNHFVLDRGGKVFKQSAPVIKLPGDATEEDHLALLGYLNSSTACFWMKQSMMNKGGSGIGRGVQDEAWESRFEFDGTKLARLPVPQRTDKLMLLARKADALAVQLRGLYPSVLLRQEPASEDLGARLADAKLRVESIEQELVGLQEEIDWAVYELFGLLAEDDLRTLREGSVEPAGDSCDVPGGRAGWRPFELELLASADEGRRTAWFERNGYALPPKEYVESAVKGLVSARRQVIRQNPVIHVLERPEYKRRWGFVDFDLAVVEACRDVVLDEVEKILSGAREIRDAREIVSDLRSRPHLQDLLERCFGVGNSDDVVLDLFASQALPAMDALIYSEEGMAKRRQWESIWNLQRLEDAGEPVQVPVPPKYEQKDFQSNVFWALRGKLDVPSERFISYPSAERDGGRTLMLGWAGWNHLEKANALATLYQERKTQDGWVGERLVPLLVGLLEFVPWLQQWHNEPNPDFNGERLGDYYSQFVTEEARSFGLTLDDLRNWRPAKAPAKKRATKKKASASGTEDVA